MRASGNLWCALLPSDLQVCIASVWHLTSHVLTYDVAFVFSSESTCHEA